MAATVILNSVYCS